MCSRSVPAPLGRSRARSSAVAITGFARPFGVHGDADGAILVADMDLHALCRVDPALATAAWLTDGARGWSPTVPIRDGDRPRAEPRRAGFFGGPHAVARDDQGQLYVTTYQVPLVRVLDAEGRHVRDIGDPASARPLRGPATACLASDGRLLVAEYRAHAIFAYETTGASRGALGMSAGGRRLGFADDGLTVASGAPGGFDRPHMCREGPDGRLTVVDTWNHRLQRFDADGTWRGIFRSTAADPRQFAWRTDDAPDEAVSMFHAPVAVAFAPDGRFVVTDWGNHRLLIFDADNSLRRVIDGHGLSRPYDACFIGPWLAVADTHNGRLLLIEDR